MSSTLPTMFVAHGSPMMALDTEGPFAHALRALAPSVTEGASAILVVSAHWETRGLRVTSSAHPATVHDFGGFPDALHAIQYPALGDPRLARRVAALVGAELDGERGFDHGVWTPLRLMLPDARLPVVALSLPRSDDNGLLALGRALAPLRDEGVLILGSGGIVHNLRQLHAEDAPVVPWAREFDAWVAERLVPGRLTELAQWRSAPHARLAAPTSEHLDPLLVIAGAALPEDRIDTLYSGFQHGTLSLRSVLLDSRPSVPSPHLPS